MTFHVGQKVVCVDASGLKRTSLAKGSVYTVDIVHARGISVAEIPQPNRERGYFFRRFRPVTERKTDISIFTKMLTPQGVDA